MGSQCGVEFKQELTLGRFHCISIMIHLQNYETLQSYFHPIFHTEKKLCKPTCNKSLHPMVPSRMNTNFDSSELGVSILVKKTDLGL